MARKVYQVRFYPSGSTLSNLSNTSIEDLASGKSFKYPIIQLGIEANEGTLFYLNNSLTTVSIGASEIFQLDNTNIINLQFVRASLDAINSGGGHIIVDYIREE